MPLSRTSFSSKDVHLLLWAVAEARQRDRRAERHPITSDAELTTAAPDEPDFFTEWQPVGDGTLQETLNRAALRGSPQAPPTRPTNEGGGAGGE